MSTNQLIKSCTRVDVLAETEEVTIYIIREHISSLCRNGTEANWTHDHNNTYIGRGGLKECTYEGRKVRFTA